MPFCQFFQVAV